MIGTIVDIVPTEGSNKKNLIGEVIRETDKKWIVEVANGGNRCMEFSKKDSLRLGYHKEEFPRYKIEFPDEQA